MTQHRTGLASVTALGLLVALAGCGASIPSDPDGTLDRVSGDVLRAGVSPNAGFVVVGSAEEEPTGSEVDLVAAFAESVDAEVEWTVGSEEALVRGLGNGSLDLVAGGLTEETPWIDEAGVTRPYAESIDRDGTVHKLVLLVPIGENAFLSALETFASEHEKGAER